MALPETSPNRVKKLFNLILERKLYVLSFALLGFLLALGISFLFPKSYRAFSRIAFKYDSVNSSALSRSGSMENERNSILSDETISFVKNSLMLQKNLKENLEVVEEPASSSLMVKAVCDTPDKSAQVANAVVETFLSKALINNRGSYLTLIGDLNKREEDNASQIQRNAANYQEFISNAEIKKLNSGDLLTVNKIADLESDLELVEYDNQLNQLQLKKLTSFFEKRFPDISKEEIMFDKKIMTLKTNITRALTENIIRKSTNKLQNLKYSFPWKKSYSKINTKKLYSTLKDFLTSYVNKKHNELSNVDKRLLENLLWKIEETRINLNAIDFSKSILYETITKLEEKFSLIPVRYLEVAQLERQKKFSLKLSKKIKEKISEYKRLAQNAFAEVDSVTKAVKPASPFSPNIPLNLILGTVAGLLLGIFLTVSKTKSKLDVITSAEDIEATEYQLISEIPNFPHGLPAVLLPKKIANNNQSKPLVQAFENIEAFLKYGNLEGKIKSVLITSAEKEEGKSLIASNLAVTVAGKGTKVLLVDTNFTNPRIHKLLNVRPLPSLPHYLLKKSGYDEIIKRTSVENLSVIPAIEVTQNYATLINSDRMKNFIKAINAKYELVIYDSTSLTTLGDTAVIANYVDQTILIARANKTKLSDINQAALTLNNYGVESFGVVLNDVEF